MCPHRRRSIARALAPLALLALVASCTDDASSADVTGADETSAPATAAEGDDAEGDGAEDAASADDASSSGADLDDAATSEALTVTVTPSEHISLAAGLDVESAEPVRVQVVATSDDHVVTVPVTAEAATAHSIPVVGMRPERTYDLEIAALDESGTTIATAEATFESGELPDDFLDFEFSNDPERSSPGVTIVEVTPDGDITPYLMAVDADGEIVWYYRNTGVVGGVEPTAWGTLSSHYWPVGVRDIDLLGNVVGNWQFANSDPEQIDAAEQEAVVDDDLLGALTALLAGNPGDPDPLPISTPDVEITSFHHEAWPMDDGNFLVLGTAVHELTDAQRDLFCPDDPVDFNIISDVVLEFEPSGRVVRSWDLWDAIDIEEAPGHELCADAGPFASDVDRDWLHANAVVYDEERDAIIISARHTNQVIALDHGDEEGPQSEVRWIFGEVGTIPVDGDLPYYQHAVEVQDDGTLLLYDNGNDRPGTAIGDADAPMYSRAVLYEIDDSSDDPADWSVTQLWEHRTEDVDGEPLYARFLGDADRVTNGNVLITHGGIDLPDDDDYQHAVLIEVDPDTGEIVWELVLGTPEQQATVYRAERLPSLYFGPDWS